MSCNKSVVAFVACFMSLCMANVTAENHGVPGAQVKNGAPNGKNLLNGKSAVDHAKGDIEASANDQVQPAQSNSANQANSVDHDSNADLDNTKNQDNSGEENDDRHRNGNGCGDEENGCGLSLNLCDSCDGWYAHADWLWWRVRRCDLDYAVPVDSQLCHQGKVYHVSPTYQSGFRVGLFRQCEDLDLGIRYTRLRFDDSDDVTSHEGYLAGTRLGRQVVVVGGPAPGFSYAESKYEFEYDVVELEASYNIELTECLNGALFGGLRVALIDQSLDTLYSNDATDFQALTNNAWIDSVHQSVGMDGYGFYLGANASYALTKSLNFVGGLSFGTMLGNFERRYVMDSTIGLLPTAIDSLDNCIDLYEKCWRLVTNLDITLGLDFHFCKVGCVDWTIGLGYEFHQWFNFSDFLNYGAGGYSNFVGIDRHSDNLGIDGAYLRLGATF